MSLVGRRAAGAMVAAALTVGARPCPAQTPAPGVDGLPAPPGDAAWERALLDQVTALLGSGQPSSARAIAEGELRRRGESPNGYSTLAVLLRVARSLEAGSPATRLGPPTLSPRRSGLEAATLYGSAIAYGAAVGLWIDALATLDEPLTAPWLPALGASAGAVTAWAIDRRPVRAGLGATVNAGLVAGSLIGAGLATELSSGRPGREVPMASSVMLGGATLGLGLGVALGLTLHPEPGAGAFVVSGSMWGTALGLVTGIATQSDRHIGIFALSGTVLGATAAMITSGALGPTPSQTRWLDLGALGGGLLGFGLGLLLFESSSPPAARMAVTELGMIGGGVAGFMFGRR
jgi:hypothetical protein